MATLAACTEHWGWGLRTLVDEEKPREALNDDLGVISLYLVTRSLAGSAGSLFQ